MKEKIVWANAVLKDGKLLFWRTGREMQEIWDFNKDFLRSGLNMKKEIESGRYTLEKQIVSGFDDDSFYRKFELHEDFKGRKPYKEGRDGMNENATTVNELLSLFKELSEQGKGDMKIKCVDGYLHKDEITLNYTKNEVWFRGYLFNVPIADKVRRFYEDIEKARDRFYEKERD